MSYDICRPGRAARQRPPLPCLSAAEVAELLGLTPTELAAEVTSGRLPPFDETREMFRIDRVLNWAVAVRGDCEATAVLAERMNNWLRSK